MKIVRLYLTGVITSDAATIEESNAEVAGRVDEAKKLSREFVKALAGAGVKVESAAGTFEPRPGAHGAVDGVDFLADPAPPAEAPAPVADGAATEAPAPSI